jgi:hypothetical protein
LQGPVVLKKRTGRFGMGTVERLEIGWVKRQDRGARKTMSR